MPPGSFLSAVRLYVLSLPALSSSYHVTLMTKVATTNRVYRILREAATIKNPLAPAILS